MLHFRDLSENMRENQVLNTTAEPRRFVLPLVLVLMGEWSDEISQNGLRAQTTTSPHGCEIWNTRVDSGAQCEQTPPTSCVRCLLAAERVLLSVLSPRYHGCVGQEPADGGHSSVDVFWESRWVNLGPTVPKFFFLFVLLCVWLRHSDAF